MGRWAGARTPGPTECRWAGESRCDESSAGDTTGDTSADTSAKPSLMIPCLMPPCLRTPSLMISEVPDFGWNSGVPSESQDSGRNAGGSLDGKTKSDGKTEFRRNSVRVIFPQKNHKKRPDGKDGIRTEFCRNSVGRNFDGNSVEILSDGFRRKFCRNAVGILSIGREPGPGPGEPQEELLCLPVLAQNQVHGGAAGDCTMLGCSVLGDTSAGDTSAHDTSDDAKLSDTSCGGDSTDDTRLDDTMLDDTSDDPCRRPGP